MNELLVGSVFLMSILSPQPVNAEEPPPTLKEQAQQIAIDHNISFEIMDKIITDESKWEPNPIGHNDGGKSAGIAQIYLPSHPEITKEQALDPLWAINWVADEIKVGREWQWTICNCIAEVKNLGAKVPFKDKLEPNSIVPRVGGVVIMQYGELKHLAYVTSVEEDGIHIKEANYKRCERGTRVLEFLDKHILGFWKQEI
jgi:hypothetical protein